MISLGGLVALATTYADDLDRPVAPLRIADRTFDTDTTPVVMGVVNLSRDSTYRESIATSTEAAIRKGRVLAAQGAHLIDVGAESSRAVAARVDGAAQTDSLLPVIEALSADRIPVSVESYDPDVVAAALTAGAQVVNLTGSEVDDTMFTLAAAHDATVILCNVLGPHARALEGSEVDEDPFPALLDRFAARLDRARELGVRDLAIDPGLGFGFRLGDHRARARYQARVLMQSFRLRRLGVPICHALPHAFDLFEDQFRSAEGVFAVLAHLGGTGVYRVHETPLVRAVLTAVHDFDAVATTPSRA